MTTFTEDFLGQLNSKKISSLITVDYNWQTYTKIIESNFPFVGSKIDWSKVSGSVQKTQNPEGNVAKQSKEFMIEQLAIYKIPADSEISIIGDGAIECVLKTTIEIFTENFAKEILELPQHVYLIPEDGAWCMSFSMEGDMNFGRRAV